ncbi:hypothetical protein RO3G_07940 [Rhizopus delemar RA 99-880]|uniref:Uncharacterized protein n=1 Tax=Rhizopus delemar (strain RA 99-880 / ATCC MYA-4621 / FGSC 9543 / NRRL 43880) TaxID=246409 RepID=I1C455_RHIO9|nr:hypothetical protein RO3G_07940 [Rhizopus delemar RA 99-880]|eukprot:EIE83235.1 hypothetical protein RO3G_07940 [Rhizopus delemar RA 99-880]
MCINVTKTSIQFYTIDQQRCKSFKYYGATEQSNSSAHDEIGAEGDGVINGLCG